MSAVPRILVLDDDPELATLLERVLVADGWEVVTARNGDEGLQRCAEQLPALMLVDLMMPKIDGHAFLRLVRAKYGAATPPAIIVSASYVRGEVGREEGVVMVIPKPFDIEEVREMVSAILRPSTPP